MLEQSVKEKLIKLLHIYACSYRNRPRLDIDIAVKISNYEIPELDKGSKPGARWIPTFDGASNALGHDIGESFDFSEEL